MSKVTRLPIKKIAVLRALKLGDFLLVIPALRALRAAFPDARIDYVGLPWNRELVTRYNSYLDGFVEFPGFPTLPERPYVPAGIAAFISKMQQSSYDLVLQMHGDGTVMNILVELLGGTYTAGYATDDCFWPNCKWFMSYPAEQPEVLKHLSLLQFLGIEAKNVALEFPLTSTDYIRLKELGNFTAKKYICIHPGAISGARWPAEQFAEVGDALAAVGYKVIITGSGQEKPLARQVAKQMKAAAIDIAGKTDLGMLGALLHHSRLLVSNDTGVAQMAVATNTPSVTIFTTADPAIWAAPDKIRHPHLQGDATSSSVIEHALRLLKEGV